jgi:hypothetical protein
MTVSSLRSEITEANSCIAVAGRHLKRKTLIIARLEALKIGNEIRGCDPL